MGEWNEKPLEQMLPALQAQPGVHVGKVCGSTEAGLPMVCLDEGQPGEEADVLWSTDRVDWSSCLGVRVVVVFEGVSVRRPIVIGLLDAPGRAAEADSIPAPKTLHVQSEEELVIECGKAKIALRSDGRIEIRGGHLISRSSGPNKIKGGTVHIN